MVGSPNLPVPAMSDRFMDKVRKTLDCWVWVGAMRPNGYGIFRVGKKLISAHRFSFESANGPIPNGKYICHSCDNRRCVNPSHLWAGSQSDNMKDALKKGRLVIKRIYPTVKERKHAQYLRHYKKHSGEILEKRRLKRCGMV